MKILYTEHVEFEVSKNQIQSEKLEMNENIGINAGKIWQYLEANGESKVVRVKRELGLSSNELYLALGWLAREGNVAFCKKGFFLWVKLV